MVIFSFLFYIVLWSKLLLCACWSVTTVFSILYICCQTVRDWKRACTRCTSRLLCYAYRWKYSSNLQSNSIFDTAIIVTIAVILLKCCWTFDIVDLCLKQWWWWRWINNGIEIKITRLERYIICLCCQDFHGQLYESYYLNFISAISRQKLEDVALAAIQTNVVTQVSKV